MEKRFSRYIRPHRLRWRLTQDDVAFLLGYKSGSLISRIENEIIHPSLFDAFALQAIFDLPPIDGFPALFKAAEEAMLLRAYEMHERLKDDLAAASKSKVALLKDLLARAQARAESQEL